MKSLIKIQLLLFVILLMFGCKSKSYVSVANTYQEPQDPSPKISEKWDALSKGLNASLTTTFKRFVKSEIPKIDQQNLWQGEAWKGERISIQLVLWSKDSMNKVETKVADFVSEKGDKLASTIAQARFVKYVITDEFAGGCGYRKPENFASSLVADPLEPVTSYAIKSNETRPLWVTIDVPSDAKAGLYKSNISLNVEGQGIRKFDVVLNVIDKVLPPASDWKFHLDLWQNPYAVSRFHNVQPWSQAHWDLLKPIMKTLADAGQKVITVSLNKRPWGGQTFDPYDAMVDWKKNKDGTWSYDYTIFDNWVQFMMDLGIKDQISCYSMVPWGNEFYYFDEAENKEVKIMVPPGTKEYDDFWIPFLSNFKKHLNEKGWNKITRMAMDERGPDEMKAMFKLLNKFAPELGASFADNHKSYKLYPNELKDMSVAFGHPVDEKDLETRKQNGYISTYYVCCTDSFPNVFTFSPPAEGVFIGWYSIAANFDGFLRWAYNSWVENPLQDSRFRAWPAGDTYIVYPDNRSSIRFETLREGIQDAEKIRILREDFKNKNSLEDLNFLNGIVSKFNVVQKTEDVEDMLKYAKKELNTLAKK
jgi:hypothetical protein